MLRLDTFDAGGGGPDGPDMRPALSPQAAGSLVSDLPGPDGAGFAIDRLCAALAGDEPRSARAQIDRLVACGVAVETLIDTYIPRAAARLGELWADDRLGFAAVTVGMARLTDIYRSLSPAFLGGRARPTRRRALFALAPGESHALGVVMAADRFERAGWAVRVELRSDAATLARMAGAQGFDLVGLSAGSRRMIPVVADTVARLRSAVGTRTKIVLGGRLSTLEADVAERTGVDGAHDDALQALEEHQRSCA